MLQRRPQRLRPSQSRRAQALLSSLLVLLGLVASCRGGSEPCVDDRDCAGGLCLIDLDRGDRYCSQTCAEDADCEVAQRCDVRLTGAPGNEDVLAVCVERVRDCSGAEICNGLDDDCDGLIDQDCTAERCISDMACGGLWPCSPAPADPALEFTCAPPAGAGQPGDACTQAGDCYNQLCEVGVCASICHDDDECPLEQRCALASSPGAPGRHGTCHLPCSANSACPTGMSCTYRSNPYQCRMRPVCAPIRGSASFGVSCSAHDQCESALCLGGVCTRPCATYVDCQGLWSGSRCEIVALTADPLACPLVEVAICL